MDSKKCIWRPGDDTNVILGAFLSGVAATIVCIKWVCKLKIF